MSIPELERIEVTSPAGLWSWLAAHHDSQKSYLLVTYKAADPERYVSRDEVLDALIAYGWIDGRRYALDTARTMQLICARKQQKWTQSYRQRYQRLKQAGQMQPAGEAAVLAAQKNQNWAGDADVDQLLDPDDLTKALQAAGGMAWWEGAAPSYRRNILRWLKAAKKPETRAKRRAQICAACASGTKIPNF